MIRTHLTKTQIYLWQVEYRSGHILPALLVSTQEYKKKIIQDLYILKYDPQKGYSYGGMIR